jgi:RNA polymerase sigma-70 factor (ECF subfamily)
LRCVAAQAYEGGVPGSGDLAPLFLAHLHGSPAAAIGGELESELRVRWATARAAWPDIAIDPGAFMQFLAERSDQGLPPAERTADLFIACACSLGLPQALHAFRRHYRNAIAQAIGRIDPSDTFLDDVVQALALKLFVRAGEAAPGIAQYRGRSTLRGWLSTAAARTALNLRRTKAEQEHEEMRSGMAAVESRANPEILLLKARCKSEFESSIRAVLAAMPAEQRTLLLLQIADGLTLPQLAARQRVSRATVARRLAAAREALFEGTRRELRQRLRLTASEYESLIALIRSQLEVDLATLVRSGWRP